MKVYLISAAAVTAVLGVTVTNANDSGIAYSGNVTLTTNYIYRGITQSDDGPAVQGGFDAEKGIFYAGTWASSVDFGDDTTMEVDFYAGMRPEIGESVLDLGFIYYAYPDSPELATGSQNFFEAYAGIERTIGAVDASAKVSYSPDFYGETDSSLYLEGNLSLLLTDSFSASAHYGVSEFDNTLLNDNYSDYNVGVTKSTQGFDIDVRYFDTTGRVGADDDAFVLTISRSM
jgi:uncharacterized protein (TIGR02001 family)